MVRQARKISPTDYYHVMIRGNNREAIIAKNWQKTYFTELLHSVETAEVVAYCLMDNHVHLVIKGEGPLVSETMRKINGKYAMRFNSESGRIGHVFQDRYKSEEIFSEVHLLQVVRYVHNNPVKAGIVALPEDYQWSSFREYIGGAPEITSATERELVMSFFSGDPESFRRFHQEVDVLEFLDTKEEVDYNRLLTAQTIIEGFFRAKGIYEARELLRSPEHLEELIAALLDGSRLSHRQIAQLLGIGKSLVHRVGAGRAE